MKDCGRRAAPAIAEKLRVQVLAFDANGGDGPQGTYFLHQGSPGGCRWIIFPVVNINLAVSLDLCNGLRRDLFYWFEVEV